MSLTVTLPYPPSANRLWVIARNRIILSAAGKAWERSVHVAMLDAIVISDWEELSELPIAVTITLHPKATKKGVASRTRIDLDNCIKPTLDAANGLLWVDDKQVVSIAAAVGEPLPDGGLTLVVELM